MAVSYVNRKCESCAGRKFQYNEKSKTWTCLYCGNTTEREETYDGLFTIKNVVRQALQDIAFRRLDSAEKNIIECEKIDSKYIGTIIANICFLMVKVTSPETTDAQDRKNIFVKIKKYNTVLQAEYSIITDDEEMLYDFFESSNIYATLLLVFNSIGDKPRCEYVEKLIKISDIDAEETNKNLLTYSLKNQRFQMFDEVISNGNLDKKYALTEVISEYPDNEQKVSNMKMLLEQGAFSPEDKSVIENYFIESMDSIGTKSKLYVYTTQSGILVSTDVVIRALLQKTEDAECIKIIFIQLCASKLSDEDVYKILEFCFGSKNISAALIGLQVLKESSQYVAIEQKLIVSLFTRGDVCAEDKVLVLKNAYQFNLDSKQKDAVINNYLCFNTDKVEDRKIIIPFLLGTVNMVSTNTFEYYVLKCNIDGDYKADVIQNILQLDMNMCFFNDLLGKYMPCMTDVAEIKKRIIIMLIEKGIKLDPKSFGEYVCFSTDDPATKFMLVKMLQSNGCMLKGDTLNNYLIGMTDFEQFSADLFMLLIGDAHVFTDDAMKNYLLYCKDRDVSKLKNSELLSKKLSAPFGSSICTIRHLGNIIECNLLQAYILSANDTFDVTNEIVKKMLVSKAKINAEIRNRSLGTSEKLKKYVLSHKEQLNTVTDKLCETHKVYSMLF